MRSVSFLLVVLALHVALATGCGGREDAPAPQSPAPSPAPAPAPAIPPAIPPAGPAAEPGPGAPRGADVADRYTQMFYAGELDALYARFSDEMKAVLPRTLLTERQAQFLAQFGRETGLVHRESKVEGEYRSFVRWARFEKQEGVIGVQWILRADDSIGGFFVRAAPQQE
jgi:hypothetical protein